MAEPLQQPRGAGDGRAALGIVQKIVGSRPVDEPDPQPARVGADLLAQRAGQRRGVVRLARDASR